MLDVKYVFEIIISIFFLFLSLLFIYLLISTIAETEKIKLSNVLLILLGVAMGAIVVIGFLSVGEDYSIGDILASCSIGIFWGSFTASISNILELDRGWEDVLKERNNFE
jgi:hypothetical protein